MVIIFTFHHGRMGSLNGANHCFQTEHNDGNTFLVIDSPRHDGGSVEVNGAGGVVTPVHGDHRYVARHLCDTAN